MYSQLKPFSLMGMSNSEILLSDNDLEFNFLVRPALEFEDDCEIAPSSEDTDEIEIAPSSEDSDGIDDHKQEQQEQERQELQHKQQKEEAKCKFFVSTLKIKLPTSEEFKINQEQQQDLDNNEDGLKTPTCLEKRIPLVLPCPPAPRKPKSQPCNKRKSLPAAARRRVLLDLSNEIESLFPPSFVVGGKIKKVRPEKDNN